jgi:hypothetical protein
MEQNNPKTFISLNQEERADLVKQIGDLIKKHGISADVKTVQEVVCNLQGD